MTAKPQPQRDPYSRERCPHCDHLLWRQTRKCWACGKTPEEWATEISGEVDVDNAELSSESLDQQGSEGAPLPGVTVSLSCDGEAFTDPISLEEFRRRAEALEQEGPQQPNYGVIDRSTGKIQQLSLLGAQWEQYRVETTRLSLTGGGEFIKELFDRLLEGELAPGAIVEVVARGIVKEHAPIYKRDGHEGKTVIGLEVVRRITVLGHMTGPVEAAQTADEEPKILDEETEVANV